MDEELDQPELRDGFNAANTLHANFYDGFLSPEAIAQNLMRVESFVARLRPLAI